MSEARQRDNWNHTSAICAALYNSQPGGKDRQLVQPAEFHPFLRESPAESRRNKIIPGCSIDILKFFIPKG